jgi:glutamine amidotransferase
MASIGILDLDIGNLRSVWNAVYQNGFDPEFVNNPSSIKNFDRLILPGVGSFHAAIEKLDRGGFREALLEFAGSGKPLLGICLGMQILAEEGEEGGVSSRGLGLIPGKVSRLPGGEGFPVPHVGWNNVEIRKSHPILSDVKGGVDFYFVHSYALEGESGDHAIGITDYGVNFTSIAADKNVVGFQFHPEKSQANGLKLLSKFCDWNP